MCYNFSLSISQHELFSGQKVVHVGQYIGKGGPDGSTEVHLTRIQHSHGVSVRVMEVEIMLVVVGYTTSWDSTGPPPIHIRTCIHREESKVQEIPQHVLLMNPESQLMHAGYTIEQENSIQK